MTDPLEAAILNGSLFRGPRTPSPTRSASTASNTPSPSSSRSSSPHPSPSIPAPTRSTGPQTGPKGVRADRDAFESDKRAQRRRKVNETNRKMERMAIRAGTSEEQEAVDRTQREERDRRADHERRAGGEDEEEDEDQAAMQRYRVQRMAELQGRAAGSRAAKASSNGNAAYYGHLREVDAKGYLKAVDEAESSTTGAVVVHIYSKLVPACQRLTSSLSSLARLHPSTKFLQVRALTIGFGLGGDAAAQDEDDDEDDLTEAEYRLRELEREEKAGDVLPTLLIYKGAELVGNLVRVDLEQEWGRGSEEDVERILRRHGAIDTQPQTVFDARTRSYTLDDADSDLDD